MQWMQLYFLLAIKVGYSRMLQGITVDYDFNIETIPESTKISNEKALGMLETLVASKLSEALGKISSAEFLGIQSSVIGTLKTFHFSSVPFSLHELFRSMQKLQ
jgi:hypothetical protein